MGLLVASTTLPGRAAQPAGSVAMLPADGYRVLYAASGQADLRYAEWSRTGVMDMVQTSLLGFGPWTSKTDIDLASAQFVRQRTLAAGPDGDTSALFDDLWTLEPDGLRAAIDVAVTDTALSVSLLVPGRLDLPAQVTVGDKWTSAGTAFNWDTDTGSFVPSPYQASFTAATPADPAEAALGCVSVAMRQGTDSMTRTWCPGRGVLSLTDATGSWTLADRPPPCPVGEPTPFDWAAAGALEFTSHDLSKSLTLYPVSPPGLVAHGTVMAQKYTADVYGIDLSGEAPQLSWNARPGGTPTASATMGGITLVANTERQLVAYNEAGRWLWQTPTTDIVVAPPVRMGDQAIVAGLDGSVAAVDLATGAIRWTTSLGAAIRIRPVVADGVVLVSNQSGGLARINSDGEVAWVIDAGVARSLAVSPGPDPVVVFEANDRVVLYAYSLEDGHEIWRNRVYQNAIDMIGLDTAVVVRDDNTTLGVDWNSGAVLWRYSAERTAAGTGGGDSVLLVGQDDYLLLDARGNQLRAWPHHFTSLFISSFYLAVDGDQVVAYSGDILDVGVLP